MKTIETTWREFGLYPLMLGRQSENDVTCIVIDVSACLQKYPNAAFGINVKNADGGKYPAEKTELQKSMLTWVITSTDTAVHGSGTAQVVMYGKDGEIGRSAEARTIVDESIIPGNKPPSAPPNWIDIAKQLQMQIDGKLDTAGHVPDKYLGTDENGSVIEKEPPSGGGMPGEYVTSVNGRTGDVSLTASDVGALPVGTKIPSATSDLTNDSGFITNAASDLANYYLKSQTYTRDEINQRISAIPKFTISVVSSLPTNSISETTIYLVGGGEGSDLYTEYIHVNGTWEILGSQRVDLTGYATETWVIGQLAGYQPKGDYALRSEIPAVPTKLSQLADDSTHRVVTDAEKAAWSAKSDFSGSYNDLIDKPTIPAVPVQSVNGQTGAVQLTASDVGADPAGTAVAVVSEHNTDPDAHNDIRLVLQQLAERINAVLDSDDATLDELSEIVAYIKSNKTLIDAITISKVNVSDIINNLTTNVANKPLSAAQGVALKALIDAITVPTKVSQLTNDAGYLTEHQDISGKLDADKLPEAVNDALAQAKASGVFDGKDGQDGYTPQKGVDYFDGKDGSDANVTAQNVTAALGYTPASEESVSQLSTKITGVTDYVHITPGTDGEKAENIREDESVTWVDGLYVNYQTGLTSQHASYIGSEHYFVLPEEGRVFARFRNNTLYYPTVAFYDENRMYLSGEYPVLSSVDERDEYNGMYGYLYAIPDDAKYYRVSFGTTAKANLEIYLIYPTKVGGRVSIPDLDIPQSAIDGKTVVCFGDSLFGMYRGEDSAPAFVAAETGATVYNAGFGGCRMSVHPTSGYAAFSMWALAKAIAENNWTDQDAQASSGSTYFPEQLAMLKSIDFSKVDIAVIHYGTNDFGAGNAVQIDNASDPDDYNTLCGALRYSLDKLLGAYPKLRIYVSLPVYRYWVDGGVITYAETYLNKGGKTLPEFVEALRNVAAEYNLPVVDGYYGLGINKANASTFLEDGTHHNATGRERFGRYIGSNLVSQQTSGKSGVDMTAVQTLIDNSIGAAIGGAY